MSRFVRSLVALSCLAALGCAGPQPGSAGTGTVQYTPVSVRSSVDRTAAWVGDRVTYTVELVCLPGYDIVADELARERLPVEGLEVRAASTTRETRDNGAVVYRARFEVASYSPRAERLRIGPIAIRYYRKQEDGSIAAQTPVGTVAVPEEEIVLHSTLPESAGLVLRVARTPMLLPSFTRAAYVLYPLGIALMVLSLVTVAIGLRGTVSRRRVRARAEEPARLPSTEYQTALNEIRQLDDTANPEALSHAFGRLDHLLRQALGEMNIHARSLTPDEIDSIVGNGDGTAARAIARVLRDCERARYGGPSHRPSREQLTHALDRAEEVLVSTRGDAR
jgi:hypothetical protein